MTSYEICNNSNAFSTALSNSYTRLCPPVRGDNSRALASGLSPVQADKPWYVYLFYTTLIRVDLAQYEVFCAEV